MINERFRLNTYLLFSWSSHIEPQEIHAQVQVGCREIHKWAKRLNRHKQNQRQEEEN